MYESNVIIKALKLHHKYKVNAELRSMDTFFPLIKLPEDHNSNKIIVLFFDTRCEQMNKYYNILTALICWVGKKRGDGTDGHPN